MFHRRSLAAGEACAAEVNAPLELAILRRSAAILDSQRRTVACALAAEPGHQPPFQRPDVPPAFVEQGVAAPGQRPLQHPAVDGVRRLSDRADRARDCG